LGVVGSTATTFLHFKGPKYIGHKKKSYAWYTNLKSKAKAKCKDVKNTTHQKLTRGLCNASLMYNFVRFTRHKYDGEYDGYSETIEFRLVLYIAC
jgi:hypothetical protein